MLEQCWDGKRAYYYTCDITNGSVDIARLDEYVDPTDAVTILPLVDDLLRKGHVTLASEPFDYGDTKQLFEDIRQFIHRWCEVNDLDERLMAGYAMLTHIHDKCPAMPLINFRGTFGVGKTRGAETLRQVCYRGMRGIGLVELLLPIPQRRDLADAGLLTSPISRTPPTPPRS